MRKHRNTQEYNASEIEAAKTLSTLSTISDSTDDSDLNVAAPIVSNSDQILSWPIKRLRGPVGRNFLLTQDRREKPKLDRFSFDGNRTKKQQYTMEMKNSVQKNAPVPTKTHPLAQMQNNGEFAYHGATSAFRPFLAKKEQPLESEALENNQDRNTKRLRLADILIFKLYKKYNYSWHLLAPSFGKQEW